METIAFLDKRWYTILHKKRNYNGGKYARIKKRFF